MGYDPLGRGGGIHGIRKRKLYHGTREGVALGVPQYREARGGERGREGVTRGERGARGDGDGRQGERGPEAQRKF